MITGGSTNIALNKPVTASSLEGGLLAASANDGNAGTRWGSAFSDPQWISIDLQSTYTISQVVLKWEAACAQSYNIQVSADNVTWTLAKAVTASVGGYLLIIQSDQKSEVLRFIKK